MSDDGQERTRPRLKLASGVTDPPWAALPADRRRPQQVGHQPPPVPSAAARPGTINALIPLLKRMIKNTFFVLKRCFNALIWLILKIDVRTNRKDFQKKKKKSKLGKVSTGGRG